MRPAMIWCEKHSANASAAEVGRGTQLRNCSLTMECGEKPHRDTRIAQLAIARRCSERGSSVCVLKMRHYSACHRIIFQVYPNYCNQRVTRQERQWLQVETRTRRAEIAERDAMWSALTARRQVKCCWWLLVVSCRRVYGHLAMRPPVAHGLPSTAFAAFHFLGLHHRIGCFY